MINETVSSTMAMDGLFPFVYFAGRGQSANIFAFNSTHLRSKGSLMKPNLSVRYCRPLILLPAEMFSWLRDYKGNWRRNIRERRDRREGETGGMFGNRRIQETVGDLSRKSNEI